jgi:hypothetical protein
MTCSFAVEVETETIQDKDEDDEGTYDLTLPSSKARTT